MQKPKLGRSKRDLALAFGPSLILAVIGAVLAYRYVDPAPPKHMVIATGEDEGDYQTYAKMYKEIMKEDGIDLEIRPSSGAYENYRLLNDPKSDVEVGFVQDGIGSNEEAPELSSLGSLYYEPIWIFYRGKSAVTRFHQLIGKKIAIGHVGGGTRILAKRLLKLSGVSETNASLVDLGSEQAAEALREGRIDAAVFIRTPEDPLIQKLFEDRSVRLMSVDQAEAITRKNPFLHHLVLPHGSIDLMRNIPDRDVDLISPTATLLVKDTLHPALMYLLLKAATQVHNEPGLFEDKNEFPMDKDFEFPLSDEAKHFYKSGIPFWQRYLPFWLATLADRFIIFVIPALALILPMVRTVPRILEWRIKSRIYKRYGELQFLETQIKSELDSSRFKAHLNELDVIEDRVNKMKVPLDHADHVYVLREHIDFVRQRLKQGIEQKAAPG